MSQTSSMIRALHVIRQRSGMIGVIFTVVLAPIVIYNFVADPIYESTTMVIFEPKEAISRHDPFGANVNFIENQVREMTTESFAQRVSQKLPYETCAKMLELNPPDRSQEGMATNSPLLPFGPSRKEVAALVQERLTIKPIRNTEIVSISYESKDPRVAQAVANSAATVLISGNLAVRRDQFGSLKTFVEEQLEIVKSRLENTESDLKKFKERNQINSLEEESKALITSFTQAQILYNEVASEKREVGARLSAVRAKLDTERAELTTAVTRTSNPYIVKLKERLVELEVLHTSFQVKGYPEDNPKMIDLRTEIQNIKTSLIDETIKLTSKENVGNLVDPFSQMLKFVEESINLEVQLQALQAKEQGLAEMLADYSTILKKLPATEMALVRLIREREIHHKTYMKLIEERENARINEASEIGNIRVIEEAKIPVFPRRPRKLMNILLGGFVAIGFGIFAVLFMESMNNNKVMRDEDVSETLGVPVLACIPKVKNGGVKELQTSVLLNEYGQLYHSLIRKIRRPAVIWISSAVSDEGKSLSATMLGATSASLGERTLLVDGDLRRPTLHSVFNTSRQPGLVNLAQTFLKEMNVNGNGEAKNGLQSRHTVKTNGNAGTDEVRSSIARFIQPTSQKNLFFVPSGFMPTDPIRVWGCKIWIDLFRYFRSMADLIIIDGPPLIGFADTNIMAPYVDYVLLCVESGKVEKDTLKQAVASLEHGSEESKKKIVGCLLNKVETSNQGDKHDYFRHYYETNKKYAEAATKEHFREFELS